MLNVPKGSSLIEILVCIAITSLMYVGILGMLSALLHQSGNLEEVMIQNFRAENNYEEQYHSSQRL